MYDAVEERIAAYEKEILRKLGDMEREEQRGQTAPPLQNANKAKAIKNRGQEPCQCGKALYRMSGVGCNPHRCYREWKRSGSGAQRIWPRFKSLSHGVKQFVSHVTLAPHVPTSGGKAAEEEESVTVRAPVWPSAFAHGGALPTPQPDRPGSVLSQDGATARRGHCRIRHRAEVSHSKFTGCCDGASRM